MKIVVDEYPVLPKYDCPFYVRGWINTCKLDGECCSQKEPGCRNLITYRELEDKNVERDRN